MIVTKTIPVPKFTSRTVRRKGLSFFKEEGDKLGVFDCRHFVPDGDGCESGFGGELIATLPAEGRMFDGGNCLLVHTGNAVMKWESSQLTQSATAVPEPLSMFRVFCKNMSEQVYAVCSDGIRRIAPDIQLVREGQNLACGCVFRERLFSAGGHTLYYSAPLDFGDHVRTSQGAGAIDLPSDDGSILSMVPFADQLYLFRENGIDKITVPGDNAEFRCERIGYGGGRIAAGTVADCGSAVYFFAEDGLHSFDGKTCKRIKQAGTGQIVLTGKMKATAFGGKYYLAAMLSFGKRGLYCYDPSLGEGFYLSVTADEVQSADGELFITKGENLYRIAERGNFPGELVRPFVESALSFWGLSDGRKLLDGVTVFGEGSFRVKVTTEGTDQFVLTCEGNTPLRLSRPVRGRAFRLLIMLNSSVGRIDGVTLTMREEDKYGY